MTTTSDDATVLMPDFRPELAAQYRARGFWGDRTIAAELSAVAARFPDSDAVVAREGRRSYRELDDETDRIGAGLLALGLQPGDRVVFQVTNRLESVIAWYACLKAALVPVATLAAHRGHEIEQISRQSAATAHLVEVTATGFDLVQFALDQAAGHPSVRHVLTVGSTQDGPATGTTVLEGLGDDLTPAEVRDRIDAAQATVGADDLAALQLSGGTTGVPKLIPRRHAEYWYNAVAYADRLGLTPDSRVAHLIPVIHNAGITCAVHAAAAVGACLVLGTPDAMASAGLLGRERADIAVIGHGHFQALSTPGFLEQADSLTSLVLSGTKVPTELFDDLERRGLWAGQLFGMAEGMFCVSRRDDPREARLLSVGTVISELDEIRLLEPGSERPVADGEVGELCCRGPYTIPGYYDAEQQNLTAFTSDGFYRTGDLARWQVVEEDPYLLIEGRIKDVINRGGEKINAEEIELLLLQHPAVVQAAVVSMPDARLGERTCAYVVVNEPLDLPEVQRHFAERQVAKFKWPERIEPVDELPRTKVGKIDKKRLRDDIAVVVAGEA